MNFRRLAVVVFALLAMMFVGQQAAFAQVTVGTGSITGVVTDPQGAAVAGAKVTITNKDNGQSFDLSSNTSGVYNAGTLLPGPYVVKVQSANFKTTQVTAIVQVGQVTSTNVKLELGASTTVVEVTADATHVNVEQSTLQDVLTAQDIDQLPVNGRNFLDLATLEPGVQIQDGATFDPTKNGYSSISFGGRYGRTARIEVDGVDISDETVGTVTQNIPQSAIQEFQVASSTLDLSTELTSSGTVNVVTKSGTNSFHGGGYYYGRSDQISARIAPVVLPFGRKQDGADFGGPIIKDKVFFFGDFERTDQSLANPVEPVAPFNALAGSYGAPFTEREYLGRADWNIRSGWTLFYRFSYHQNLESRGFNSGVYQPFDNIDHTPTHVVGTDFTTGKFTHSIRFEYLKFRNEIQPDANALNPVPGIALNITPNGSDLTCLAGGEEFCSGANILAPQATFQEDRQVKYDGSYTIGTHVLRYGVAYNGILGGGFAKFFAVQPAVTSVFNTTDEAFANTSPFGPGGASNPANWPVTTILDGNGQGFSTERPGFNLPAGAQYDHRFEAYFGDQWKVRHNLTVTAGLHYGRDTGRTDSDLAPIPALALFDNQFFGNLQDRVRQPNKNFGPQIGLAWDPRGTGKTVIRAGAGIYYENAIFNNVLFDRPGRIQTGLFLAEAAPCFNGAPTGPFLGNTTATYCGEAVGTAAAAIDAGQVAYQAATAAVGAGPNPNFIGTTLQANNLNGITLFGPNYRSPISIQMNGGVQHQFGHGTVLSVDYARNVGTHTLLALDTNKVGDARFLNIANAQNAISTTNASFGCGTGFSAAAINCSIGKGAQITNFAGNGLDSGFDFSGGAPCPTCAFGGVNPNVGQNEMLFPIGRSTYNALLVELKSNVNHPMPGVKRMNLIASYALSRYRAQALDSDFINNATDFNDPLKFTGPNGIDRTHQVSVGAIMDFPWTTRIAMTGHWDTATPLTLALPQSGTPGEVFRTDVTGDGTNGDPVPGSNIGSFGRSIKKGDLNNFITNYSGADGNQLTPAGSALVSAGLFTSTQLQQLCAITPSLSPIGNCAVTNPSLQLALAPPGNVGVAPVFTFDIHAVWELKMNKLIHALPENVVLEPSAALFNVFNYQNHDSGLDTLTGVLNGGVGSVNGTTAHGPLGRTTLVTPGTTSGVNWYGVPRQAEFGAKLTF
jgi:carboxypeptidase family protein